MSDDTDSAVEALADLASRCGATGLEIGFLHDDVPAEEAGWWAMALFQGTKITVEYHRSRDAAALALARRLLSRAGCRCGRIVTLTAGADGCLWVLDGRRWEPGCPEAKPVRVRGNRGDFAAMKAAMGVVREAAARANAPRRGKWRRRG